MSSRIEFEKLHGAGNDFIFIEDLADEIDISAEQVQRLCDRHFGIGADGVIVVKPPRDPRNAGFMHYINADGTLAEMCGNGIRCFSKYLVDHRIVDAAQDTFNVETRAGVKAVSYTLADDGTLETASVDMGAPILDPALVPTTLAANATTSFGVPYVEDAPITSPYGTFSFTCVSMGNPHAVCFVSDCDDIDVNLVGSFFESNGAFPEKANIEFATVSNGTIRMRVYERGCGETLACGTGACATNVAACLTGRASCENDLVLAGGTLHISYTPGGTVMMTGPAVSSFSGAVCL